VAGGSRPAGPTGRAIRQPRAAIARDPTQREARRVQLVGPVGPLGAEPAGALAAAKVEVPVRARASGHRRAVVRAASRRAQLAIAQVLAAGSPAQQAGGEVSPAILQRAAIACSALEGVVRAAIEDDPDRLRDPAWIEQVVKIAVPITSPGRSAPRNGPAGSAGSQTLSPSG
jgi:hypothetical protein